MKSLIAIEHREPLWGVRYLIENNQCNKCYCSNINKQMISEKTSSCPCNDEFYGGLLNQYLYCRFRQINEAVTASRCSHEELHRPPCYHWYVLCWASYLRSGPRVRWRPYLVIRTWRERSCRHSGGPFLGNQVRRGNNQL